MRSNVDMIKLDCTNIFFTNDVVRERNKLPPSMVHCITICEGTDSTKFLRI